jgi:hypothetical protein
MKTIKFEDALKDYLEEMMRTGWYTNAYKAFVEANILKLVMERPVADPNATMMDLFDATEMTGIVREAETMTEAFMKSEIERMAREFYHRLRQCAEAPVTEAMTRAIGPDRAQARPARSRFPS